MSLNDSSSVVAGDESRLVPVCGRPGVVDVDVLIASSWCASFDEGTSSLKKSEKVRVAG